MLVGTRYALQRRIATGGMGEVWLARDGVLGRRVAVKLLRADLAGDPGLRLRFRAEAQLAAALVHPNVVAVFDYGEIDDAAFLAMEYVDGESLGAVLRRRGRLDAGTAMQVVGQAATALAAAHAKGLVHRDVKPANLLVRPDGTVKVTDFGIARMVDSETRTQVGTVLGTVGYMSPEQVRGERVGPPSDVYSLGVVAYECLAGRRPHIGEPVTVALAHIHDALPPLPAGLPAPVVELVRAMVAKEPAQRPLAAEVAGRAGAPGRSAPAWAEVLAGGAPTAEHRAEPTRTAPVPGPTRPAQGPARARTLPRPATGMRRRRRGGHRAALAGALGVVALLVAILVVASPGPGGTAKVRVPAVTGQPMREALHLLRSLRLRAVPTRSDVAGQRDGQVVRQRPRPGTAVKDGSRVALTVATGYVDLSSTSLDGMAQATASAALRRLGLVPAAEPDPSATAVAGTVLEYSPSGRLLEGSTVTLQVATAVPPTTVPSATTGVPKPRPPGSGPGSPNNGTGPGGSATGKPGDGGHGKGGH